MSDDEFLEAFEECRIPKAEWTHEAHVRMAWLYLRRRPLDEVVPIVREGIRRYNSSLGNTARAAEVVRRAKTFLDETLPQFQLHHHVQPGLRHVEDEQGTGDADEDEQLLQEFRKVLAGKRLSASEMDMQDAKLGGLAEDALPIFGRKLCVGAL